MTEQQIKDGFEQLEGALAPPPDASERVARRVAVRRRRRRATAAGATAVVAALAVGTAVTLAGGGDDGSDLVAVDPPGAPSSTLVLTRPDGSTYAFDQVTVTCDPPPYADPSAPGERIWAYSPRHIEKQRVTEPWLYVEAIVDKVSGDQTFTFPADWDMDSDELPMVLFVADSVGEPRGNEVSTDEGGAAGTVRVLEASCDPTPVLRLSVDTDLGSEIEMGTLHVTGDLR